MICLTSVLLTVSPLTAGSGFASMYLKNFSTNFKTYLLRFFVVGNWSTSVETTSQGFIGIGRASEGAVIHRCPVGFLIRWQ